MKDSARSARVARRVSSLGAIAIASAIAMAVLPARSSAQAAKALPTPESVIGFPVGTDYKLFTYDQSIDYFKRLAAAASSRVKLITVGKTSFGKTWTAAIISSPANLARLDALREINQKLAHPANLTDAQARQLAKDGRAFVDISGGLHASEIAGSQHTPQVAYELLSRANEPEMKAILDSTVFFLWPSINPDGQDIVVNWCRARDVGPGQTNPVPPMELYQKYVGHDNNRDSYMLNMVESRVSAAHVARVGAADHLRAASVVALPDAHLAAAVRRSGRLPRSADHGASGERDRHAHRHGAR